MSRRSRERGRDRERSRDRRSNRVRMEKVEIGSPSGKLKITVLPNAERLSFAVSMNDVQIVEPSALRMFVDGFDLTSGVVYGRREEYEIRETYPWHGVHSVARNHCRGVIISLQHDLSFTSYTLELRAFDDGAAYRFVIPGEPNKARVPDEYSNFVLPAGAIVWFHDLSGHYEAAYQEQDVSKIKAGQWAGPPVTFQLPGDRGYGAITEANLVDYSGMALESDGRRSWTVGLGHRHPVNYPYELRYGREQAKRLGRPAPVTGTITTPWRVVIVGRELDTLVNSDILPNLCPPADKNLFSDGIKTPWLEPGLAVWRYVDGGDNSFEGLKEFSRMGSALGARYHIVEGLWTRWTEDEIRDIVDYSRERGVNLLFWKHSRELQTPEAREEFFRFLHERGVAGAIVRNKVAYLNPNPGNSAVNLSFSPTLTYGMRVPWSQFCDFMVQS